MYIYPANLSQCFQACQGFAEHRTCTRHFSPDSPAGREVILAFGKPAAPPEKYWPGPTSAATSTIASLLRPIRQRIRLLESGDMLREFGVESPLPRLGGVTKMSS